MGKNVQNENKLTLLIKCNLTNLDEANKVSKLVDDQRIKTTLGQNLGQINVEHITQAHTLIESGKSIGKIVLAGF